MVKEEIRLAQSSFDGKVAVITGSASGMGEEAAVRLAKSGAKVVAVDLNEERGQQIVEDIKSDGHEAIFVKADVTVADEVKNYVDVTLDTFGQIDLFYNNAGIVGKSSLTADIAVDQISSTIDINLKSVLYGLKYVIQAMEKSGGGAIVNTASGAGLAGTHSMIAYSSSKHGVVGATKTAALEYADKNIRVNAIAPGSVKTPMIDDIDPEAQRQIEASIPMKRQGTTSEIIDLVIYLLSENATYITGSVIAIDGAHSA